MAQAPVLRATSGCLLAEVLNREWVHLVDTSRETVRAWADRHSCLQTCRDLDDVLEAIRAAPDECLPALLTEDHHWCDADADRPKAGNCELAGRVVLQTMLDKMIMMARRDPTATLDDYVSLLWVRIRTYPLRRRPARIAATLALDTLKDVCRERRPPQIRPTDEAVLGYLQAARLLADRLDHQAAISALTAGQVITAAFELDLINPLTSTVLFSVYHEGLSGRQAAARHQMSTDLVRWRCSKAVRRLARHAAELADAACAATVAATTLPPRRIPLNIRDSLSSRDRSPDVASPKAGHADED